MGNEGDADGLERHGEPERRGRTSRAEDYRVARIAVAITLSVAICVLVIADAFSADHPVSLPALGVLGVMVLTLLGLEARDILRGGQ